MFSCGCVREKHPTAARLGCESDVSNLQMDAIGGVRRSTEMSGHWTCVRTI